MFSDRRLNLKGWILCIADKPKFALDHPRLFHGWAHSTRKLTCAAKAHPAPEYEWFSRGEKLVDTKTFKVLHYDNSSSLQVSFWSHSAIVISFCGCLSVWLT